MVKGSGTTGSKEEDEKGSKKPLIVRPPKLKNTSANIKQLMKNEEAIRSQIENAHTEGKFGETDRMRLVKMLSPIPSLFDAEKTAEQIAKDHSDTLESLGELLAKSGSGIKKFAKGSQEAKDFMASIRAKRGTKPKCPCGKSKKKCCCVSGGAIEMPPPRPPSAPPPRPPPPSPDSSADEGDMPNARRVTGFSLDRNLILDPRVRRIVEITEHISARRDASMPVGQFYSQQQLETLQAELVRLSNEGNQPARDAPAGQGIKGTGGKSSKISPAVEEQMAVEGDDRVGSTEPQRMPQAMSVATAPLAQSYPASEEYDRNRLISVRMTINRLNNNLIEARRMARINAHLSYTNEMTPHDIRHIQNIENSIRRLYAEQDSLLELITPETIETEAEGSGLKKSGKGIIKELPKDFLGSGVVRY